MAPSVPLFDFYDEVRICTQDPAKSHMNTCLAIVVGRTETEDRKSWYYAVDFPLQGHGWCFFEYELEATGRKFTRDDLYDGSSVRVQVDPKGRGRIIS